MRESVKIILQCLEKLPLLGNYEVAVSDAKLASPSRKRLKDSMESLIHHFKLFTEGYSIPESSTYVYTEAPKGEFGVFLAANGTNKPFRCHIKAPGSYIYKRWIFYQEVIWLRMLLLS
jgi:NADH:ubiquinone oxidoreductase subunit D